MRKNAIWWDNSEWAQYIWKTRDEVEAMALNIYTKLFKFHYKYNVWFKQDHDTNVTGLVAGWWIFEEVEQWAIDGTIEWWKDYIMFYHDAFESFQELTFEDISSWFGKALRYLESPIDNTKEALVWFKDTIEGIYDKTLTLTWYDLAKGTSYVWTNVWLSAVDPASKILTLAGGWLFIKVGAKIDNMIPDYIKLTRSPIVTETFLKTWYTRTGKKYNWAEIFKDKKWKYYYIDTFHKWKWSHIEVFDKTWAIHLWEAHPITWIVDYSKADPKKKVPKNLR
jgi:hypothetical protein